MGMFVVAPAHHDSSLIVDATHHHHHYYHHGGGGNNAATTAFGVGVGVGVIPLLTPGPCLNMVGGVGENMDEHGHDSYLGRNWTSALQFWQTQKSINFDPDGPNLLGSTLTGGGTTTCQDCGNQAKKDCSHRRCRTCCRSRGYDCSTHVKSTWVPAAKRRERLMIAAPVTTAGTQDLGSGGGRGVSSGSDSEPKKPRLVSSQNTGTTSHTSASNTPPRSFETSSCHQDASFKESLPGQVRAPAVFKCVRVMAVDDGDDEFAYQAIVKIGGHVFKGFLYGHGQGGVEPKEGSFPNFSDLHLGGGCSSSGGRNGGASTSSPLLDSSVVYGASGGGGLLGGSSYGNTIS